MAGIKSPVSHIGKIESSKAEWDSLPIFERSLAKFKADLDESFRIAYERFAEGKAAGGNDTIVNPNTAEKATKAFGGGFLSPDYIPKVGGVEEPDPERERWKITLKIGNFSWEVLEDEDGNKISPYRCLGSQVIPILEAVKSSIEGMTKEDDLGKSFHELAKTVALAPKAKKMLKEDGSQDLYEYDSDKDIWVKL